METNAYNKLYLSDAQLFLANAFDYGINTCKINPDFFSNIFSHSKLSREIEVGNPAIISGMSSIEFIKELFSNINSNRIYPSQEYSFSRSKEYWVGYVLSYYQWISKKTFKYIFDKVPLKEIISMYDIYHEMDISIFVEDLDNKINKIIKITNLQYLRKRRGLSQSELASLSGVSIRMIQLYEQKVNEIDKAQVQTLYKLSRVLGVNIEDLLETPEVIY